MDPKVTIIVLPHERFNVALRSLDNIFEHTSMPYDLVYVDVNSPNHVCEGLRQRQEKYGFTWVRKDHFIQPNEARNIGLSHANTPYLVFIDNDVLVTDGWLEALMDCAEETGAWLVGPLILETGDGKTRIHSTVSESQFDEASGIVRNRITNQKATLEALSVNHRHPSELLEYHCILIKAEAIEAIGGKIDEGVKNTRSHMDLCWSVRNAGGKIYFEPNCRVQYLRYYPIEDQSDADYVKFHYDDEAIRESIRYFESKWDVKLEPQRLDIVRGEKSRVLRSKKLIPWYFKKLLHRHKTQGSEALDANQP